jgi:membrane-bound lytic murein transglycosylase A
VLSTPHREEHQPPSDPVAPSGGVAYRRRRHVDPWRLVALLLGVWAVTATLWVLHLRGDVSIFPGDEPLPPPADGEGEGVLLRAVSFSLLPGWSEDRVDEALPAMERSCRRLLLAPGDREVAPSEIGGRVDDWRDFCNGILALEDADEGTVRSFLETEAVPVAVFEDRRWNGLFTGYYEPLLRGSRRRREPYTVPLYRRPPELVSVDLGDFRDDLAGRRLAGEVVGGRLRPFRSRSRIEEGGALTGRGLELVWVDDPVDAFFLQIQGSGTVLLDGGKRVRVGYAGQNGHPYYAIGRELIERGALTRDEVSMQSIRAWLAEHPEEGRDVMATNASYVFFRELEGGGPVGSQGVELTARRSLAVDRRFIPLGAPVWLHVAVPAGEDGDGERLLSRLMVAQDTGGAIRGAVRGDVFWGAGVEAAAIAGRMRHTGRYWLLLPRRLAERIVDAS